MMHRDLTLKGDPVYNSGTGNRGGKRYWAEFYFKELDDPLTLTGRQYRSFDHPAFLDSFHENTLLTIDYRDRSICQIAQNGQTYLTNLALVAQRERHAYVYGLVFLFAVLINCTVPVLLRHAMGENLFRAYSLRYAVFLVPITCAIALLITFHIFDTPFGVPK